MLFEERKAICKCESLCDAWETYLILILSCTVQHLTAGYYSHCETPYNHLVITATFLCTEWIESPVIPLVLQPC